MLGREHLNNHTDFVNRFVTEKVEDIKCVDISINSGSNMEQTSYLDTVNNMVRFWLLSRKDDRIRKPKWAGFFDTLLQEYSMDDDGKAMVEQDLQDALKEALGDQLSILEVVATPDPVEQGWTVGVKAVDKNTHLMIDTIDDTDNQVFVGIHDNPHYTNIRPEVPIDYKTGNPEDPTSPAFWGL